MKNQKDDCFISVKEVAQRCGISVSTVYLMLRVHIPVNSATDSSHNLPPDCCVKVAYKGGRL